MEQKEWEFLWQDFLKFCDFRDPGKYTYFPNHDYEYITPEKAGVIFLGDEKVRVCPTVVNAKTLMEALETGHKNAMADLERNVAEARRCRADEASIRDACWLITGTAATYFMDALRYSTLKLKMRHDNFEPLAQSVNDYLLAVEEATGAALEYFGQKSQRIADDARQWQRSLDAVTTERIQNAPSYLHIRGRFHDGLFGPTFTGTAYETHSWTDAQIRQSYEGNRSAARSSAATATNQLKDRVLGHVEAEIRKQMEKFPKEFKKLLGKYSPPCIYSKTLMFAAPWDRPYLKENIMRLINFTPVEDMEKLFILIKFYKIEGFIDYFEDNLFTEVLDYYKRHGTCDYDATTEKLTDFYEVYADYSDVYMDPELYRRFRDYFVHEVIIPRRNKLIEDKSIKITRNTTKEELVGDIIEQIEECRAIPEERQEQFADAIEKMYQLVMEMRLGKNWKQ